MTPSGWKKILYRLGLIAGLLFLAYQVSLAIQGFSQLGSGKGHPGYLVAAFLCITIALAIQVSAWLFLMDSQGARVDAREGFSHYYLSFVSRYIPGSVWGYFSRAEWLKERAGISYARSNAGSILEIAAGLLSVVLISALNRAITGPFSTTLIALAVFILLPLLVHLLLTKLAGLLQTPLARWGISGLLRLSRGRFLAGVCLLTLNWYLYGLATYLVAGYLHLPLELAGLAGLTHFSALYSLAWLIGFLILFIPSGLGIRESVLSLQLVLAYGITSGQASAIAVVLRTILLAAELTWLGMNLLLTRSARRNPLKA